MPLRLQSRGGIPWQRNSNKRAAESSKTKHTGAVRRDGIAHKGLEGPVLMVWPWYNMVEVCAGTPVAVGGWVIADRHDLAQG